MFWGKIGSRIHPLKICNRVPPGRMHILARPLPLSDARFRGDFSRAIHPRSALLASAGARTEGVVFPVEKKRRAQPGPYPRQRRSGSKKRSLSSALGTDFGAVGPQGNPVIDALNQTPFFDSEYRLDAARGARAPWLSCSRYPLSPKRICAFRRLPPPAMSRAIITSV